VALVRVAITVFCVMVLCGISAISCAKAQPAVTPTPPETFAVPMIYRHCEIQEMRHVGWPTNGWVVTFYCPDGIRLAGAK
jgi:hypothetical protein